MQAHAHPLAVVGEVVAVVCLQTLASLAQLLPHVPGVSQAEQLLGRGEQVQVGRGRRGASYTNDIIFLTPAKDWCFK